MPIRGPDWMPIDTLLDDTTGFPVSYTLRPVPPGDYVFGDGSRWADPSIDDAAEKLRIMREEPVLVRRKCAEAMSRIARDHGPEAVGARMAGRLSQIFAGL